MVSAASSELRLFRLNGWAQQAARLSSNLKKLKRTLSFSWNDHYRFSLDWFVRTTKRIGNRGVRCSKSNSSGSCNYSTFRRAICRCLPPFFDLALSVGATTLPS
jgi:hypothetical protein